MKILIRKVWVGNILHNFRLKIQGRRSALPQAWELIRGVHRGQRSPESPSRDGDRKFGHRDEGRIWETGQDLRLKIENWGLGMVTGMVPAPNLTPGES